MNTMVTFVFITCTLVTIASVYGYLRVRSLVNFAEDIILAVILDKKYHLAELIASMVSERVEENVNYDEVLKSVKLMIMEKAIKDLKKGGKTDDNKETESI